MSTVRYASDYHFLDVSQLDWRGNITMSLTDIAEMIIDTHNRITEDEDLTFMVGDIGIFCEQTIKYIQKMKGDKILILGNHDDEWKEHSDVTSKLFKKVLDYYYSGNLLVAHKPDIELPPSVRQKTYYVHGHHHLYNTRSMQKAYKAYYLDTNRYNCCVDLNRFKPCTIQELMLNKAVLTESVL